MLRKAALQLHIGAQSSASPSRNEGFREFEADLSALFYCNKMMKVVLYGQSKLSFIPPKGITLVQYNTGRGITVDAFKDDQVPGQSSNLFYGSQELSTLDTGAENIPDSESDVTVERNGMEKKSVMTESTTISQKTPNGNIGMGGLY